MMFFFRVLVLALLAGCVPTVEDSTSDKDAPSELSGTIEVESSEDDTASTETGEDDDGSGDDLPSEEDGDAGSDSEDEPDESAERIVSGVWVLGDARLVEDACHWDDRISAYAGVSVFDFLPDSFTVQTADEGFQIKARDYGARDFIDCDVAGDSFSCSMQTVDALQVMAGWPTYWEYEIDFSGSVTDSRTLVGQASVEYPQVNPGDDWNLQVYGMEHTECGQVFELTLTAVD